MRSIIEGRPRHSLAVSAMLLAASYEFMPRRVILVSLASGLFWAVVAIVLGRPMAKIVWGGIILAPFIALAAGFASRFFPSAGTLRRALFSLVSLYVAAALFGLGVGVYDLLTGPGPRIPSAVVIQAMLATLWGLTFTGYFAILWPLSYVNHSMVLRAWDRKSTS
jgi:hypothetical protein